MKKTHVKFYISLIIIGTLLVVSAVLNFTYAVVGFLVAFITIFQIRYSNEEPARFTRNSIKLYYHRRGRLDIYRKGCIILFVIFFVFGCIGFCSGILQNDFIR